MQVMSFLLLYMHQFFTRTPWWMIPLIWMPVICWLVSISFQRGLTPLQVAYALVAGIFIWTLLEYSLHRFVFHIKTESYWLVLSLLTLYLSLWLHGMEIPFTVKTFFRANTLHYLLHGCHHKHPMDGLRLVFPPVAAAIICVPVRSTLFDKKFVISCLCICPLVKGYW